MPSGIYKRTKKNKQIHRLATLKLWKNKEYRNKVIKATSLGRMGMKFTKEHRKNISRVVKEHMSHIENRLKISRTLSGKSNYWRGKHLSKKHRDKISNAQKGCKFTKDHCSKISKSLLGKKLSEERIKSIRNVKTNIHHIDLDDNNDNKANLLRLNKATHQRLHRLAYHYLVYKLGIKEVYRYIEWFKKYHHNWIRRIK